MRKLRILIVTVTILMAISDTYASNNKSGLTLLLTAPPGELSKTQRTEIAEDLLQKIRTIDSYIPALPGLRDLD